MVSYDLLLFMLKIESSTQGTNSMPSLVFRRDHLCFGIICSPIWGSFLVWGSFVVEDHLWCCTDLFNKSLSSGIVPNEWECARVTLFF